MQALKALVIFMGVLIIAGMAMLVYGLMTRVGVDDRVEQATATQAFGLVESVLPAGATVAGVSVDGGRVVVDIRLPDGGAEVRAYDLATGAALGSIRLKVAP
jgi:hypothetical protein